MKGIVFIGAGGHSKSVKDSLSEDFELLGFLDENKRGTFNNYPIFGNKIEDVPDYKNAYYFVTIGDNRYRKKWFELINRYGLKTINIIDKTAIVSADATIGNGNFIGKYAVINAGAFIGDNNIINTKALVEHECIVGSHTHLSTNSTINGNVIVDDEVFMGSTAVCIGQQHIAKGAVIGAGSVIINDVEAYTTVVGIPGKIIKRLNDD